MLNLEIVTPERVVLNEKVEAVSVPTSSGDVGILTNHVPMISALRSGVLSYTKGGATEKLVIAGGFVEVSANKVSILADFSESAADIDIDAAKQALDAASKAVAGWQGTAEEYESYKDALDRAQARVALGSGK